MEIDDFIKRVYIAWGIGIATLFLIYITKLLIQAIW